MKRPNVSKAFKTAKVFTAKHRPEIFTAIGIGGMFTAIGLAVKATPKAVQLIEEKKEEIGEDDLTVVETVQAAWKPYVPAAITCALSTACLIGASSESARRTAALATAYKISETALAEYKEKVVETIGERKEKTVREKIHQDKIDKNPVSKNQVILTEKGHTLCYDPLSDRYFRSDIDRIHKAENELNAKMIHDMCGYASINDFYNELGLPHTEVGDMLGWNVEHRIKIYIDSHVTEDGQPCIVVGHTNAPKYEYYK